MAGKRARLIAAAATLVVAVSLAAFLWAKPGTDDEGATSSSVPTPAPALAERKAVAGLGRIEPSSETIEVGTSLPGRLERLDVEEGDVVEKGQLLGHLEQRDELRAERDAAQAELEKARDLLAAETAFYAAKIEEAEIRTRQIAELTPLEISAKEAELRRLQATHANNLDALESDRKLLQTKALSRRSVEDQQTVVRQSEEDLKRLRAELARLKARFAIDRSMAQNEIERTRADRARALANIGIASLEAKVRLAEARSRRSEIHAPIAGQVLKILARPGERVDEAPILDMGATATMHAVAEIYETDIGLVRTGQRATVRSPALDEPLSGKVVHVGHMIFKNDVLNVDPAADADARVVEVRIALDDSARVRGLTNLTVDVIIDVASGEIAAKSVERP